MPIVITIPNTIREKLGDEGAEALTEILNKIEESSKEDTIELAEQRFEKHLGRLDTKIEKVRTNLDAKIEKVRVDLDAKIKKVKADLSIEIEKVKADLSVKIERVKADIIKWMFIFWVGQVGVLIGILFAFFK